MTQSILTKLVSVFSISFIGFSTYAEANWSIPTYSGTKKTIPYSISTDTKKLHVVQIFSSTNATKAEGMKNTLSMHGYPAFVKQTQSFYQVQIGPYDSKHLANDVKSSIIKRYPTYSFLNDAILKISQ